jgi:hypothetical protein
MIFSFIIQDCKNLNGEIGVNYENVLISRSTTYIKNQ